MAVPATEVASGRLVRLDAAIAGGGGLIDGEELAVGVSSRPT